LLLDLWTPVEKKRDLGYLAAGLLGLILIGSFKLDASTAEYAFGKIMCLTVWRCISSGFSVVGGDRADHVGGICGPD